MLCNRAQVTSCQIILKPPYPCYQPPALFLSFDRWRLIFFFQLTEEKGTSPPDYRHYLRMWAKEKEVQKETIKDLPKMNQVGPIRIPKRCFWKIPNKSGPSHPPRTPGMEGFSCLPLDPPVSGSQGLPRRTGAGFSRALFKHSLGADLL